IVLEPLASAEAVLSADEQELGILLVEVGGGTTNVALFREGAIWHTAILPLGGDHVTNDIAVGLRTPVAEAEDLKRRYGCALTALVSAEETIDVPSVGGRKPRRLSRQILSEIVQPRVEEVFTLMAREMAKVGFQDAATAGVVVTGGTSIMEGVPELAEAVFDLPVRRGLPETVGGLADVVKSPIYSTGVGLALYGARRRQPRKSPTCSGSDSHGLGGMIRRLFERFGEIF
ncbi:MAG: cell division protein FtsA, partial [Candidatus Rokuibacteriota bacterium]